MNKAFRLTYAKDRDTVIVNVIGAKSMRDAMKVAVETMRKDNDNINEMVGFSLLEITEGGGVK